MFSQDESLNILLILQEKDIKICDLAKKFGVSRQYMSALIHRKEQNLRLEMQVENYLNNLAKGDKK